MRRLYLPAAAALGLLAACQPQPLSQTDEDALRALSNGFVAAVNAANMDGMTAPFASDAVVQPNGMPAASGTAAIRKLWTDMMTPMTAKLRTTITKVSGEGNVAYLMGTYHVEWTMKDATQAAPPPEDGKWISVAWRQPDKSWKFMSDTWNPNSMPTAAAAPARPARRH